jgi:ELWxxDGT repeat protein
MQKSKKRKEEEGCCMRLLRGVFSVCLVLACATSGLAATNLLRDIRPGIQSGNSDEFVYLGSGIYILNGNDGIAGKELWISNGTTTGTQILADINPGPGDSDPTGMLAVGGDFVLFRANNGIAGDELWKTNGTATGTVLVKDINPGAADSNPGWFEIAAGVIFFSADDGVHGDELWKTDGTAAGTVLVKDINPGAGGSSPQYLTHIGSSWGKVLFTADDGVHGRELWVSDGTAAGTFLVKDINPGAANGYPSQPYYPGSGAVAYFAADNGAIGRQLWESDGTNAGTKMYTVNPTGSAFPSGMNLFNGKLVFAAFDAAHGQELWSVAPGDYAGAVLLRDINPGPANGNPYAFAVADPLLLFIGNDGVHGAEPWRTDGTTAGTQMVKDVNPGAPDGSISWGEMASTFYTVVFFATDGVHGAEPWVTDGWDAGTAMLRDVRPGATGSAPVGARFLNNRVWFKADDGIHGAEPWWTDALLDALSGGGGCRVTAGGFAWLSLVPLVLASFLRR